MERHRGDLERDPGQHEHHPEDHPGGHRSARSQRCAHAFERGRAGEAVSEANTEQKYAAGECAEHEILEPRFRRTLVRPQERRKDVSGERVHLQPDVKRHEITGRNHDPGAERGEQDQHRIFGAHHFQPVKELRGNRQCSNGRAIDQQLGEAGKAISAELAEESYRFRAARPICQRRSDQHHRRGERDDRGDASRTGDLVSAPTCSEQQEQPANAEQLFRRHQKQRMLPVHQCAPSLCSSCGASAATGLPEVGRASPTGRARATRASSAAMSARIGARKLSG